MKNHTSPVSLNFAVIIRPPSVLDCYFNSILSCPRPGAGIEMAELMCRTLNYDCTFNWAGTDVSGYAENGTWYGVVGYIKNGSFDISLPIFAPTADRWTAVDLSEGYFYDNIFLVTRSPSLSSRSAELDLLGGFRWQVWGCIAGLLFLASHVLDDMLIIKRKKSVVASVLEKHVSKFLFHCHRFCIALMSLAALILLRSYTGYIFSQDVTLYPKPAFHDLPTFVECLERNRCQLATTTTTVGYLTDTLHSNDGDLFRRLRSALEKKPVQYVWPMSKLLSQIQNETSKILTGFVWRTEFYFAAKQEHCNFYKLSTAFSPAARSIPVKQKSPLLGDLNRVAHFFRETGISTKIINDYLRINEICDEKQEQHAASFAFLMDVFIFFGAGAALSILGLLSEFFYHWIAPRFNRVRLVIN